MKSFKYLPITIMAFFCLCMGWVGIYAISLNNIQISGSLSIIPADSSCKIEYAVQVNNVQNSSELSFVKPAPIYINSTNSASGELVSLTNTNQNINLGSLFFSSHSEAIEDICISITLKNKSIYPVIVNFSFGSANTVGVYSDNTLKEVYLSSNSQSLGNSATLYQSYGLNVFDFYLKLKDPTSDLTTPYVFDLDISFTEATNEEDIVQTMPVTYATMVYDEIVSYMQTAETITISDAITSNRNLASKCKPFTFKFTLPHGVENSVFELATNLNFENAKQFNLTTNSLTFENLLVNTNYYYRITFYSSNVQIGYRTGIISTTRTPRLINIDGAVNTRDIAGWQTSVNIKQGMVIRGTEIDGLVIGREATEKGLNALKELGIVMDFDLRSTMLDEPVLTTPIDGAGKLYFNINMYKTTLTSEYDAEMKRLFTEFAKPTNYPMYIHCAHGCDKTGTMCFLLEALLGASSTELAIEYELSNLYANILDREYPAFITFLETLDAYSGSTIQEKVTSYLLSIGITEEQIQSIKDILLED